MEALTSAPEQSIFVLEGCCHNPTGQDYSQTQWAEIADMMLAKGHFAYLDTAYQGLGQGSDQDAWAVRHFAEQGVNMLVAQSFSKNMGLYSERVGALHVVCSSATIAANVLDQMRSLLRWEVSSSPSYGAQLVEIILSDTVLRREWQSELQRARQRLTGLRRDLHALLTKQKTASPRTGTVEGWSHLLEENGLFSFTGLTNVQAQRLIDMHHIYLPGSGRINVSGLNADSIERVARAFHDVITC